MSKSCKGLAMELVKCLSESDCVKVTLDYTTCLNFIQMFALKCYI